MTMRNLSEIEALNAIKTLMVAEAGRRALVAGDDVTEQARATEVIEGKGGVVEDG